MTVFRALVLLAALLPLGAQQPAGIVFSADTGGALRSCDCPAGSTVGLPQRGSLVRELRRAGPVVLLDAGNSLGSHGAAVIAAYDAIGYDAAHLASADLAPSAAATRALLASSRTPFVAANLVDARGELLAKPFVVLAHGSERLAVLGVSELPVRDDGAVGPLAVGDQWITEPAAALAEWLPRARAASDRVVLLWAGSAAGVWRLSRAMPAGVAAILVAGARPRHLPANARPMIVGAEARGAALTQVELGRDAAASRALRVVATLPEDPACAAALAAFRQDPAPRDAGAQDPAGLPLDAEPERTHRLGHEADTGRILLRLRSALWTSRYGARQAGDGRRLLVLDSEWSNSRSFDPSAPSLDVTIADLAAALALVVDGATEVTLVDGAARLPGHVRVHDLALAFRGRPQRGNLVFELPAERVRSLALRLRDPDGREVSLTFCGMPPPKQASESVVREPKGLDGVGVTAEQVNAAIQRASEFLWKWLASESEWPLDALLQGSGNELLVSLALTHAGAHERTPAFDQRLRRLLSKSPGERVQTYQAGVLAMLIEAWGRPEYLPRLREITRYLVESQGQDGSWDYSQTVPTELLRDPDQRVLKVTGGTPLDGSPKDLLDCPRTLPVGKWPGGDNSVTQFALLGLAAAARLDMRIPTATWQRARSITLARQLEAGGFGYAGSPSEAGSGSMTCAGLCALAITAHGLSLDPSADAAASERALAWLDQRFDVARNPGSSAWNLYYLYGLERTGRILETEFLGAHEWYPLGVRHLLATQLPDGSWDDSKTPPQDTAFALLFLTRATHRLAEELKRGGSGTLSTASELGPERRLYVVLDASGSMLDELDGMPKFQIARDAVAALVRALPGGEVALRVYGHRKRAIEPGAESDTELAIPLGPLDQSAFLTKLQSLRARGRTPLSLSLAETHQDLERAAGETTVLLLTDGGEDTRPKREPAAVAEDLGKLPGIDLQVIGFDIKRDDWRAQLEAIAQRARGRYWPVARAAELASFLRAAVLREPESFRVVGADGREVGRGRFGDRLVLREGRYRFETELGGKAFSTELWVNTDAVTSVVFDGSRASVR
jgi:hypothetical protein